MSNIFENSIKSASRMIRKFGQKVTWKKATTSVSDVERPWEVSSGPFPEYFPYMVILPLSSEGRGRVGQETNNYRRQSDIQSGAVLAYMEAVGFEPSIDDIVLIGGKEFRIRNFDALNPNGSGAIYYTLELTK